MKPVYVTKPSLPPLEEFIPYLEKIWQNKILTNNGPFHQELEAALCRHLGVEHISLFTNGTIALVTALQALKINGEVITTPYSFVATAHSLLWNNLKPVFVDVDPLTYNLDPSKIEEAITPQTSAILPVHCYGNPCNVGLIKEIADTYGLKVIYDAAHAFGVKFKGQSVLNYGDLSVLSFHATKVFNTFEGGAIVAPNAETKKRIDYLKNFGFADEVTVTSPGINGKMSELNAAFGLVQLRHVGRAIARRKEIAACYRSKLLNVPGIECLSMAPDIEDNGSYFPIMVGSTFPGTRDHLYEMLKKEGFFCRRYFFPLISNMPMYRNLNSANRNNLIVANRLADQVLCLPLFSELDQESVNAMCDLIKGQLFKGGNR